MAFLFKRTPGSVKTIWENVDVLNLPNPVTNKGENVIRDDLNIMNFLYDSVNELVNPPEFGYYKY